ncbi:DNA-binding helix-turn-helix protein [Fusobacterium nucleatum subsp. nucleatum ATCC 23726]|uniref:DNA-binding helix-turn-helix protein n=1 Tax=Fusobacterium nucleatum subsp. nucleatum (strain ATCC 23726 / VPI 4351) TaxID=525283 RepID=D5RBJ5_FUSN2|nr:DNA-binding helix-turn-helix protein [Fusobacterium nucleatum subsp. nucleatum ATCC 23726]
MIYHILYDIIIQIVYYIVNIFLLWRIILDRLNILVSENIKRIRQEKNLSLGDLAKLSDVSKSMLAQIERGEGNPTLSTLWKIANGMQVSFNTLIAQPKLPYKVTKLAEIEPILDMNGGLKNYSLFSDIENNFSVYQIEVGKEISWISEAHLRGTAEFVIVIQGTLEIKLEEKTFILKKGENLWFKADVPHSYCNLDEGTTIFHNILYNK